MIGTAALTMSRRSMKPPTSTPASDSALIIWPVREVSNSCLASHSIQHSRIVGSTRPTMTNSSQNATAQLPATSDITLSQPAGLGLNAVMNSSAATNTN